jgi:hypothetical protein
VKNINIKKWEIFEGYETGQALVKDNDTYAKLYQPTTAAIALGVER